MKTPTHITIRMDPEFKCMAQEKARKAGLSLSTYIKTLINEDKTPAQD